MISQTLGVKTLEMHSICNTKATGLVHLGGMVNIPVEQFLIVLFVQIFLVCCTVPLECW